MGAGRPRRPEPGLHPRKTGRLCRVVSTGALSGRRNTHCLHRIRLIWRKAMSTLEQVAEKLAISPTVRNEHPSLVMTNKLLPDDRDGIALPVPPGKQVFWRVN